MIIIERENFVEKLWAESKVVNKKSCSELDGIMASLGVSLGLNGYSRAVSFFSLMHLFLFTSFHATLHFRFKFRCERNATSFIIRAALLPNWINISAELTRNKNRATPTPISGPATPDPQPPATQIDFNGPRVFSIAQKKTLLNNNHPFHPPRCPG